MTLHRSADKIRALMSPDLSQPLNLLRLAKAGERFEGAVEIDKMARVADLLRHTEGDLSYCLCFEIDEHGQAGIEIKIKALLAMICQRCLQPMQVAVSRDTRLAIIADKSEMQGLPLEYEPLVLTENKELTLLDLIEDELLLAVPLAPLHPETECSASEDVERIKAEGKVNPFAELAKLKKTKD